MTSNENPIKVEPELKQQVIDFDELRARSLRQGGFRDDRKDIWPQLLGVSKAKALKVEEKEEVLTDEASPHSDERQIGLDTDRSFVLYPVEPKIDRETLQAGLHKLLVSLFRKRPQLSYFQGFHDIVTVFFLTLPQELQLPSIEKVSLHRLRDSMGPGLEPILGLLRVTKNLLRLADPDYAGILEQSSPLPFYALSNLLTLFSHDMPTLPLIQHVFDYLLCRPPIASVYLATAIILSRKKEVLRLQEDEDGMIHSLLSSLPDMVDDFADPKQEESVPSLWKNDESTANDDSLFFKDELESGVLDATGTSLKAEDTVGVLEEKQTDIKETNLLNLQSSNASHEDGPNPPSSDSANDLHTISPSNGASTSDYAINSLELGEEQTPQSLTSSDALHDDVGRSTVVATNVNESDISTQPFPASPKVALTELLRAADSLYEKFPPSHSGLALSSIMGPQSVIFTWSEVPSELPSDHTAEAMVAHPHLVVYPYVEPEVEKESSEKPQEEDVKGRRKRRKLRKSPFGQIEKKTMLAGTVLVLGVAMAVYGIKARHAVGGHSLFYYVDGHAHPGAKDWKRVGGWLGGAFAGISQKILNGLS